MDTYEANTQLADALRGVMEERAITQMQVAETLGRSQSYVSARIIGKHPLSSDIIVAVASLAHLTPRALVVEMTERMGRASDPDTAGRPMPGRDDAAG